MNLADEAVRFALEPLRTGGSLAVQIDVHSVGQSWSTQDACLEPVEVYAIARWLKAVARGKRPKPLGFTEPNLEFELVQQQEQSSHLRIWEGELRPEWATYSSWEMRNLGIELTVPHDQLLAEAEALRKQLDRLL